VTGQPANTKTTKICAIYATISRTSILKQNDTFLPPAHHGSHGKSPYDGIGSIVKWLQLRRTSRRYKCFADNIAVLWEKQPVELHSTSSSECGATQFNTRVPSGLYYRSETHTQMKSIYRMFRPLGRHE
jgi:hypothetical protein